MITVKRAKYIVTPEILQMKLVEATRALSSFTAFRLEELCTFPRKSPTQ